MQKEQIFELMNKNPVLYLATTEGDEPRVRAMMLYKADETGIVFHTGPHKDVFHQILKKPQVQMCFYDQAQNVQIRVRGALERTDDEDLKEEISSHPSRAFMRAWKTNSKQELFNMFSVFRLKNGLANVWTFESNFTPKEDIEL